MSLEANSEVPPLSSARTACRSCRSQRILVMQPTEHRFAPHRFEVSQDMARPQHRPRYDRWRIWHAGTQHHVRACSLVVADPGFQYKPQMGFRQWNEPIQAFSTDGADQPLADAVRPRTAWRNLQHSQPEVA